MWAARDVGASALLRSEFMLNGKQKNDVWFVCISREYHISSFEGVENTRGDAAKVKARHPDTLFIGGYLYRSSSRSALSDHKETIPHDYPLNPYCLSQKITHPFGNFILHPQSSLPGPSPHVTPIPIASTMRVRFRSYTPPRSHVGHGRLRVW